MTTPSQEPTRVAIACGGTGGHLFPGVAVARQLMERGCAVTLLISPKEVDQEAVKTASGMEVCTLPAVGLQAGHKLAFVTGCAKSLARSVRLFRRLRPAAALAMGGFTSAPPILAARMLGARVALHESNTIPGRANRWLARIVHHAFVGFPGAAERLSCANKTMTGTPARPEFQPQDSRMCRAALGLDPARPVVLVMGGSQGAAGVNRLLLEALPLVQEQEPDLQWVHLSGRADMAHVRQTYASLGVTAAVHPFFGRMELALGAATVAVSRAGASSLAEIAAMRLPSILVPYPAAMDNHQFHNARALEQTGAAQLLEQHAAQPAQMAASILELLRNTAAREAMIRSLPQWHTPNAARHIAELILSDLAPAAEPGARPAGLLQPEPAAARGTIRGGKLA